MTDALNKKVEVGDKVAYSLSTYGCTIKTGRVTKLTPKGVKIKGNHYTYSSEFWKSRKQIVKIGE